MAEPHAKNTGDDILWIVAIIVFIAVLWWIFGKQISVFIYWFFWVQARSLTELYQWLPSLAQRWTWELAATLRQFRPGEFSSVMAVMEAGGRFWLPLETLLFLGFGWALARRGAPRTRYRRKIDLRFLIRENAKLWPALRPVANLDLLSMDPDNGPWARAKSEYQFAIEHGILKTPSGDKIHGGDFRKAERDYFNPNVSIDYVFDRKQGRRVMRDQLKTAGKSPEIWRGFDALDPVTAWVCAICLAFLCDDEKKANWLIDQANTHYHFDPKSEEIRLGLPIRDVAKTIRRYEAHELVVRYVNDHYFTLSVVSSLWKGAKEKAGRRLATNRMRWLKTVDRTLFYTLNQVGRQTAWVEASMVRAVLLVEYDMLRYRKATGKMPPYNEDNVVDAIRNAAIEKSVYSLEKTLASQDWFVTVRE